MSNAAKHRKKAAEFEQLKQIDRAIASYIKAIEESESAGEDVDVALFNKVGDLTLRQGRVADAVTYYERAVEHYATSGLFNNAIALCNKILRSAPGRANVYFTLGRICAKKGLRGDATRNFLEYATRMQQEGRLDEGMRALAEVADLMPELTEVRRLVEEHATRVGIALPRRKTPPAAVLAEPARSYAGRDDKSSELVFLDLGAPSNGIRNTPPLAPRRVTPPRSSTAASAPPARHAASFESFLLFDPNRPGAVTPPEQQRAVTVDEPRAPADEVAPLEGLEVPIGLVVDESGPRLGQEIVPVDVVDTARGEEALPSVVEPMDDLLAPVSAATTREEPFGESAGVPADAMVDEMAGERAHEQEDIEVPLEGLETHGVYEDLDGATLEGLVVDGDAHELVSTSVSEVAELTWLLPPDEVEELDREHEEAPTVDPVAAFDEVEPIRTAEHSELSVDESIETDVLSGLVIEDFEHAADAPTVYAGDGVRAGLPTYDSAVSVTPLDVSPIPELDAAIEAGALTAALADADPELTLRRPPFRLDPHDFILPGELPPLIVDDAVVGRGMEAASVAFVESLVAAETEQEEAVAFESEPDAKPEVTPEVMPEAVLESVPESESEWAASESERAAVAEPAPDLTVNEVVEDFPDVASTPSLPMLFDPDVRERSDVVAEAMPIAETVQSTSSGPMDLAPEHEEIEAAADAEPVFGAMNLDDEPVELVRGVRTTPVLPIAAVAAEANAVATSRRDELREAVARTPNDLVLRRRLAEALFEAGEREGGLSELQAALSGHSQRGELPAASDIADELVRISPDRIAYHQKRVELAIRLGAQERLRAAYLDLADAFVRSGDEVRAHAVYARVLELDPWDERARAALGSAAPPPPPRPAPTDDERYVDLTQWLREDEPATTRMRMREPEVSGDEQADFDALLRHFKEGVARSLGEEDFESHYDLGVAYKEMGLLDDAIAEFQMALRSRRHRLPAYEALGQCFVEQSRHSVAATVLTRALHEPGLGDAHRVGVLYLLAYSCEALQRWDEARSYYSRVYATDINFRDVAARLAALDLIAR